jgi:ATP-dependent DNA ligase
LVVQVAFAEWTGEPRRLRHPVALGRRDDVDPGSIRLDQPPHPPTDVPS